MESIYRFGRDLDTYKNDSVKALAKLQASREKQKPGDPLEYRIMVCCLCSTKLADVASDILCIPDYNQQIIAADSKFNKYRGPKEDIRVRDGYLPLLQ